MPSPSQWSLIFGRADSAGTVPAFRTVTTLLSAFSSALEQNRISYTQALERFMKMLMEGMLTRPAP